MVRDEKKCQIRTTLCLILIVAFLSSVTFCCGGITAEAAVDDEPVDVETHGLVTTISIKVGSSDGNVWALAHNDFTLGISTIQVYVELYSSLTFKESYREMTLESKNYIGDLNINKSIETYAPINGIQRYWRGRVYYKMDKKDWVSKETTTYLVGIDGKVIR
jgi:hypothetical protein